MKTIKTVVIFGASGDLTTRKLIPALFGLFWDEKLLGRFFIVGVSRTQMSNEDWRERLEPSVANIFASQEKKRERFQKIWQRFAEHLYYFPGDIELKETFIDLDRYLRRLEGENFDSLSERIYYLALAPDAYETTARHLGETGMAFENDRQKRRLMVEKPFGADRTSAENLSNALHHIFRESQIFRIDHYLGKETVNNIFVLRFANTIFEPIWDRHYVDHLQITAGEAVTVGRRGAFYEKTQVLRDMFQNHLLQLLAITTMDAPSLFDARSIRDEKVKVLNAVQRVTPKEVARNILFGQYDGYRSENGVAPHSRTPTFAVMRLSINNERWKGVPIYLRSGKGMGCLTTQVVVQFRKPMNDLFGRKVIPSEFKKESNGNLTDLFPNDANRLLIQIQPSEGIRLSFLTKIPGTETQVRKSELTFAFHDDLGGIKRPENAYERLFLDAFNNDASLFARDDEITTAWEIIDPFVDQENNPPLFFYPIGSWGPTASDEWMAREGKRWFNLCPLISNREDRNP